MATRSLDVIRRLEVAPRAIAVAALFGAELIHTSMISDHLREWQAAGYFFVVVSVIEGLLGAALWFAPSKAVQRAAVVISLLTVWIWVVSRTVGVPFGPDAWVREAVGVADVVSTVLELATAAVLVALAVPGRVRWSAQRSAAAVAAVLALTGFALAAGPAGGSSEGTHAAANHKV